MLFFFFKDTATPEIYPLSLHDALPILRRGRWRQRGCHRDSGRASRPPGSRAVQARLPGAALRRLNVVTCREPDRRHVQWYPPAIYCYRVALERSRAGNKVRSEEHTSELQSQSNLVCRLLLEKKK